MILSVLDSPACLISSSSIFNRSINVSFIIKNLNGQTYGIMEQCRAGHMILTFHIGSACDQRL